MSRTRMDERCVEKEIRVPPQKKRHKNPFVP
jgi:hypothetical protein